MDNYRNIKDTIYSFFKNNIPEDAQLHFQHWLLKKENEEEKNAALNQLWDDIQSSANESTFKDLRKIHRRINYLERKMKPFHIYILRVAIILILPIIASTVTYFYLAKNGVYTEIEQCYVPKGEIKHLTLPDGTEIWINSDSYLSFPKKFSAKNRTVSLTGEAYLEVNKNEKSPFIVQTQNMNVVVLGTKFNVNAYPDQSEVKTTLHEGKVKVEFNNGNKEEPFFLSPFEELSLNVKTGDIIKREINKSDLPSWNNGNLTFHSALLSDILKQMERKYKSQIAIGTNNYENKRLTVKFENGESIDEALHIIQLMVPEATIKKENKMILFE